MTAPNPPAGLIERLRNGPPCEEPAYWLIDVAKAEALCDEAATALEEVLEALEPFARAVDEWGDDTGQPDRWSTWEHPIAMNVTLGDFRKARATIAKVRGDA